MKRAASYRYQARKGELCVSLTMEELRKMQHMNIMDLDRTQLANAENIVIDTEMCLESRIRSFMEQTKNPFAQNVGEYILQVGFAEEAKENIDERMLLLIKRKTQMMC